MLQAAVETVLNFGCISVPTKLNKVGKTALYAG